jgi:ribonuclease P/MRP protein subunit RPP40
MVSDNLSINCGVPQGSVLGPLHFLIYINDLPLALPKNKFTLFADDTTTCISSRSLMSLNIEIEHTQVQIFTWFTANKLVVNKDKTQSIIFSLREIGENSKTIKLLGIHLDTQMTWEAHADHLVKTISKKLFVLRQLRSEVNDKTLVTAYDALVHSNITYAILVWGHSTHLRKVFNQQRRCIRVLGGLGCRDDCRDIFKTFKILTVPCIYIFYNAYSICTRIKTTTAR